MAFKFYEKNPVSNGSACVLKIECLLPYPPLMSPVSPVFHTEATVNIGLKNVLRVGTFILEYYMSML